MPSCVSFCVATSNMSLPSPSIIRYSSSAFLPMSASEALMLPMAEPTVEDSGMRRWTEPAKKKNQKNVKKNLIKTPGVIALTKEHVNCF